jgi:Domain of Unknown Function (DUF1080)
MGERSKMKLGICMSCMKHWLALTCAGVAMNGNMSAAEWTDLLDERLTRWEVFTGVPHPSVEIAVHPAPLSAKPGDGKPFGPGDPLKVFTVRMEEGEPVLHVTGQIFAGLSTLEEFGNYHLTMDFRWGERKWPPREEAKRDSGLLYHCTGPHGAFWNVWMRSLEFQIQEGDCGDFIPLAGTAANIRVRTFESGERPVFAPDAPLHAFTGYTRHSPSKESPHGEWNKLELYTLGTTSVFVVNGTPNMVLFDARVRRDDGNGHDPLVKGKIQLQSEAAEAYYRRIMIRKIDKFPVELTDLTTRPTAEPIRFVPVEKKEP